MVVLKLYKPKNDQDRLLICRFPTSDFTDLGMWKSAVLSDSDKHDL